MIRTRVRLGSVAHEYLGMKSDPEPIKLPKPEHLAGHASAHWDAVVPLLVDMVELRQADAPALEALCLWWGEYRTLQETSSAGSGEAYKRSIALASCFKNWSNLAARFGLTPRDRERLTTREPERDDPAAAFLA